MFFFSPSGRNPLPWLSLESNSMQFQKDQLFEEHYNLILDKHGQWNWETEIKDNLKHLVSFSPFLWQDQQQSHEDEAYQFKGAMKCGMLTMKELESIYEMRTKRETTQLEFLEDLERRAQHFGDHEEKVLWKMLNGLIRNHIEQRAHCIDLHELALLVRHALQCESLTDREFDKNTTEWIQNVFPHECDNFSFVKELMEIPALVGLKEAKQKKRGQSLPHQRLVVVHCFISADTPSRTFPDCWKKFAELYFTFFSFESVRGRVLGPFCNRQYHYNEVKSVVENIRYAIERCVETILDDEDVIIRTANLPSFDEEAVRAEIMEKFNQWDGHGDRTEIDKTIGYSADEGHVFREKLESYIQAELEKRKLDFGEELQERVDSGFFAETFAEIIDDYFQLNEDILVEHFHFESLLSQDIYAGLIHGFKGSIKHQQGDIVLRLSGMHFAFVRKRIDFFHALIASATQQVSFANGSNEAQLLEWLKDNPLEIEFSGESERDSRIMCLVNSMVQGRFFNPLIDCLDTPWYQRNMSPLLNWTPGQNDLGARIATIQSRLYELGTSFGN